MRTVSELAALAGVSVRTLHHYDELGLLRPEARTDAGYRLYGDAEARRLHDILLWRSFGFPLDEVKALLDDPHHDPVEALRLHRERLVAELGALTARVAALDRALAAAAPLSDDELRVLFDGIDVAARRAEAEARWGDTDAFREARARTARYGRADWEVLKAEQAALGERLAACFRAGTAPDAPAARDAAAAHRAHLERWFYAVPAELHLGLARTYVDDARFTATYDAFAPGLAAWLHDAIVALHRPRRTL